MTKSSFILIVALGIILRFFLMASSYHPDLAGQSLSAYFFSFENITNIYDHLLTLKSDHPLVANFGVSDIFIYPPLTYFTLGLFQKIIALFFHLKIFLWGLMSGFPPTGLSDYPLFLFLLKAPYLIFDFIAALLLFKLFKQSPYQKLAILAWIFNPVNLYATYCMGVFDIIPVTFCLLSLYLFRKQRFFLSALSLGLGAAYKMFPLFLLPFVVFGASKKLSTRFKLLMFGLLPLILTNLPYLFSSAYRYMVFSPKSQKMLYLIFPLTAAEGIYPFIVIFSLMVIIISQTKLSSLRLNHYFLAFFLLLFSLTHYHPQWFLWITPFMIIDVIESKFKNLWFHLILVAIYILIVFTFDNSLSLGLFYPLFPQLKSFIGIDKLISSYFDINYLKSLIRSLFAAVSLYLSYRLLK